MFDFPIENSQIMISLATIGISFIAWWTSYKNTKISLESSAFSMINETKLALDKILVTSDKEKIIFDPLIEDYLNSLNYACSLYDVRKINRKRFRILYAQDIKTIFASHNFSKVLDKNPNDFTYLRKTHVKIIELNR